jgi:hypothetical protein
LLLERRRARRDRPRGGDESDTEKAIRFFADEFRSVGVSLEAIRGRHPSDADLVAAVEGEEKAAWCAADLLRERRRLPLDDRDFYRLLRSHEFLPVETFETIAMGALARIPGWKLQRLGPRKFSALVVYSCRMRSPWMKVHMSAKQTVRALLDQLPDDCSIDEVLYHLYVVQAVELGQADVAEGRTIPHEQVKEELRWEWILGSAR